MNNPGNYTPLKSPLPTNFAPLIFFILLFFIAYVGYKYKSEVAVILNEISSENSSYVATTPTIIPSTSPAVSVTGSVVINNNVTVKKAISTLVTYPTPTQIYKKTDCTNYKITTSKFASNKCYVASDYNLLVEYLGDYLMAEFSYKSAKETQKFTCTGSDFFKDSCEDAKDRADDAKDNMESLEKKINSIIARGS